MKPSTNPFGVPRRPPSIEAMTLPEPRSCSYCGSLGGRLTGKQVTVWTGATPRDRQRIKKPWSLCVTHTIVCRTCIERMAEAAGLL